MRAEVEGRIGFPIAKEDVLATPPVTDTWFVATRQLTESDRLLTSATWLYGTRTGRWAKLLNFAHAPSQPTDPWPLGSLVETPLAFYPGIAPDRALPTNEAAITRFPEALPNAPDTIATLLARTATTLAENPWRTTQPFLLHAQPARHKNAPVIVDPTGQALNWSPASDQEALLLSISAGHPIPLAGEWDGHQLQILAASDNATWFPLSSHLA